DMQNGYMEPGMPAEIPVAREIAPNISALSQAFRAAGTPVIFTLNTIDAQAHAEWSNSSELPDFLAGRGIDTVVIVGTATNICCECSARDAMMQNYKVIGVSDATATYTDEEHNSSLDSMRHLFADVVTTDEILAEIGTRAES
ncbi:cysteine hydrolase, partial [Mesorhizobium sp. BR1-1-7]|uniref:isochorismatase family cysteine hydrolase n=1 Tax=Mesorhizobium sp. BR1-1-7 TaxID=2876647 RepID=UPI001CCBE6BD